MWEWRDSNRSSHLFACGHFNKTQTILAHTGNIFSFCLGPSYLPLTSKMDTLCSNPSAILSLLPYTCKTKHSAVVILHANLPFCVHVCSLGNSQGLLRGTVYYVPSTISESSCSVCFLLWVCCALCLSGFVYGSPVYLVILSLSRSFLFTWQLTTGQLWREKANMPVCHRLSWIPNSRNPSSQYYHYLCDFLFCLCWFWTQYFLSWAPSRRGLQLWINTSKSEPKFRWDGSLSCLLYSCLFR